MQTIGISADKVRVTVEPMMAAAVLATGRDPSASPGLLGISPCRRGFGQAANAGFHMLR
jgi:hypothetical protein